MSNKVNEIEGDVVRVPDEVNDVVDEFGTYLVFAIA